MLGILIIPPTAISVPSFNTLSRSNSSSSNAVGADNTTATLEGKNFSVLLIKVLLLAASIKPIDSYGAYLQTLISSSVP